MRFRKAVSGVRLPRSLSIFSGFINAFAIVISHSKKGDRGTLRMKPTFTGLIYILLAIAPVHAETVSPLQARGYTVMPQPQVVKLGASDFEFGPDWKIEVQGAAPNDVAIETLRDELGRRYRLTLGVSGANVLRLILAPNSVAVGEAQDARARIRICQVEILADAGRRAQEEAGHGVAGSSRIIGV